MKFKPNVGGADRAVRIAAGLALMAVYVPFGLDTCPARKS
jgi:hypothetical protein